MNNHSPIWKILSFPTKDIFYVIQLIQRKKENDQFITKDRIIATFYVNSFVEYNNLSKIIPQICDATNARAMISVNSKSYRQVAFNTLQKITTHISNEQYRSVKNAYASACGENTSGKNKLWILDVDSQMDALTYSEFIEFITDLQPVGDKVVARIPSKQGMHIITRPFRLDEYRTKILHSKFSDITVIKNGFTNLYIP